MQNYIMLAEVVYHSQGQRKMYFLNSYIHIASLSIHARSFPTQLHTYLAPLVYHTCIFISANG